MYINIIVNWKSAFIQRDNIVCPCFEKLLNTNTYLNLDKLRILNLNVRVYVVLGWLQPERQCRKVCWPLVGGYSHLIWLIPVLKRQSSALYIDKSQTDRQWEKRANGS